MVTLTYPGCYIYDHEVALLEEMQQARRDIDIWAYDLESHGIALEFAVHQGDCWYEIYQTLILLPYLMSMVVVSYLAYAFLGDQTGIINSVLKSIGLRPIRFYATKAYWPFILTFVNEWRVIGYSSIIYLATLVGLGSDCYEAAMVDGATKWQQIRYITLPQLKPTVIMMTTLAMGTIFRSDFGLFYQIPRNQGMLYPVTDTIDTYVFRALLENSNIGLSSAAAFYQSVVCFITIIVFNAIVNKISKEDALF